MRALKLTLLLLLTPAGVAGVGLGIARLLQQPEQLAGLQYSLAELTRSVAECADGLLLTGGGLVVCAAALALISTIHR